MRFEDVRQEQCPYCGEWVDVRVDGLGPSSERYVEDCPVCCRPWTVEIVRTGEAVELTLSRLDA